MPKIAIEAQCESKGIGTIEFPEDTSFRFMLRCCNCGEETTKPVHVSQEDEIPGIRNGSVNFSLKCKLCDRVNDVTLVQISPYDAEKRGWQRIIEMECRGLEPSAFVLDDTTPLSIKGVSGFEFEEAAIDQEEFYGYDDKEKTDVSITEWETRVVKIH